ncbi:hypothetical protein QWY86_01320 [Pedobacter aquatilis]|nr:hypothetical protein [Pedobacter aquatilis]MDN3585290.1 hypothetical protein [Pedobacter aquatilis]
MRFKDFSVPLRFNRNGRYDLPVSVAELLHNRHYDRSGEPRSAQRS